MSVPSAKSANTVDAFRLAGLDWTQVEPGTFCGTLTSIRLGCVRVFRERFNLGSKRQGPLKPGTVLLGTISDVETHARWFGMPATADDVAVGSSIDVAATGPGELFSVLLDPALLPDLASAAELQGNPGGFLIRNAAAALRLRRYLQSIFAAYDRTPAIPLDRTQCETERTLLAVLRRATQGRRIAPGASFAGRFQAVRNCEAYMSRHIDETISLAELSAFSGLRQRSLINAFEAFTGLSPMAYLKTQRLNGARTALLDATREGARIIDIAMDWGFAHMGHFAADYRAMFGERPSQTKRLTRSGPMVG